MQPLLRVSEAADRLGISRATAYSLISKGELPSVLIGHSRRVRPEAIEEYVRKQETAEAVR